MEKHLVSPSGISSASEYMDNCNPRWTCGPPGRVLEPPGVPGTPLWGLTVYFLFLKFVLCHSRAAPAAYGSSQTRGWIGAVAAGLHHSHSNAGSRIWATSAAYTTAHGNAGSLIHWARSGIKPVSSWILAIFVSTKPQRELLQSKMVSVICTTYFKSLERRHIIRP